MEPEYTREQLEQRIQSRKNDLAFYTKKNTKRPCEMYHRKIQFLERSIDSWEYQLSQLTKQR
jgi:hypothetical protein